MTGPSVVSDRAALAVRAAALADRARRQPEPRWALACDDSAEFAAGLLGLLAAGKTVVLPQSARPASASAVGADILLTNPGELMRDAAPSDRAVPSLDNLPGESRVELCTSGSTGEPKQVVKRLDQLLAEVDMLESQWGDRLGDAAIFATVPHHHLYGLLFRILWPLRHGRPFARHTCLQPFELTAGCRTFRRTALVSSPAFLSRLENADALPPADRLCMLFSSGAPLDADTAAWLQQNHGRAATEIYGSTETGGIGWRRQQSGAENAWTLLPGVELRAGDDTRVRSPWTADRDWVATGDRTRQLTDGRVMLDGRSDSVVKFEDKRVSLPEMAARICEHPDVGDARVVIVPGSRQRLGAVVVTAATVALDADARRRLSRDLRERLRAHYDPVLLPRRWRYVDALPGNSMGKVSHAALLRLFGEPA